MASLEKILIIKLGAMGDFIQALGLFAAIRRHHPHAEITLLTGKPFAGFAEKCGYVDQVWVDKKPKLLDVAGWFDLRKKLNGARFSRVYDLQNNDRTCLYFKLFNLIFCQKGNRPSSIFRIRKRYNIST